MNDNRLDDRIRELYAELTEAAPDVPPLPAPEPARRPLWARPAALAAAGVAVVVLVLGVAAVFLTQLDEGDDEAAVTQAPATTQAPAATVEVPGETFAPATTSGEAADDASGPGGTPRPTERILLLADLNRLCTSAQDALAADLDTAPASLSDYGRAFDVIASNVFPVRELTVTEADLADDQRLEELAGRALAVLQVTEQGPGDDPATAAERFDQALVELDALEALLVDFGAADCDGLAPDVP